MHCHVMIRAEQCVLNIPTLGSSSSNHLSAQLLLSHSAGRPRPWSDPQLSVLNDRGATMRASHGRWTLAKSVIYAIQ